MRRTEPLVSAAERSRRVLCSEYDTGSDAVGASAAGFGPERSSA